MPGEKAAHSDRRRAHKRYPARWKVAVVFDKTDGRPTLHTTTLDLSVGGAAIVDKHSDLTGSLVTLLLARPVRPGAEPPKIIRLRAQVVSSVHLPAMSGYRHGLRFLPSKDDDLGVLASIIDAAESARRGAAQAAPVRDPVPATAPAPVSSAASTPASAAAPTPAPAPVSAPAGAAAPAPAPKGKDEPAFNASPGSLLARLREAAAAKLREEAKPDPKAQFSPLVGAAVKMAYHHLKDVVALLDTVKPAYPKAYSIHGLPDFDDLKWAGVHLDFRTREISPTTTVFEQVTLSYHLDARKSLSAVRELPADKKLERMLDDSGIKYSTEREKSAGGAPVAAKFAIPCEVRAALQLAGDFETGKLTLKLRNVGHFGTAEYLLSPEAVTKASLDELVQFIMGETRRIGSLLPSAA